MKTQIKKGIGSRVRDLRGDKFTQADIASMLEKYVGYGGLFREPGNGIKFESKVIDTPNSPTVSKYESGGHITILTLLAYAEIFNVSVDYLLGRIDSQQPEYKSIKDITGLTDGAIHSLKALNEYNKKENVIKRLRLNGISGDMLEKKYEDYTSQLKDQHNEEVSNLVSCALYDEEFWRYFNDGINNIFRIMKCSPDDSDNIEIEKNKITNRFGKLVDDCIEHFQTYHKKQRKLF